MSTYVRNCYCTPSRLFILGGSELYSAEGTTQGDPLAMPVYAVGLTTLLPLIKSTVEVKHAAYADDLGGLGKLIEIRTWWDNICKFGPLLGYYPEPSKSWLIVKEQLADDASQIFSDTEIKITTEGRKYLGGFIGKQEAQSQYAKELVSKWIKEVKVLSKIAKCEPQTAYTAFVGGYRHKLTYHIRTFENLSEYLKPLDDVITSEFIPAITEGRICSEDERLLLSLPVKLGGLAIPIFSKTSNDEFENSKIACKELTNNIKEQKQSYQFNQKLHSNITNEIVKKREAKNAETIEQLRKQMSDEFLRANDLAQMKGSSSWLTALPLKDENYILNKREFFDALAIRYRWQLKRIPSVCACGKRFNLDHAMSCLKGGFIHQRHDIIRDTLAKFFSEVCTDVEIEPALLPLTGEILPKSTKSADDARLDIAARSFWQRGERALFDIRVFNPFAPSYSKQKLPNAFLSNEREKKRAYNRRVIEVEHGSFTPFVSTPYGGYGREAERCISELAILISKKRDTNISCVSNCLRTKLSFITVRSAVLCVRGTKTIKKK